MSFWENTRNPSGFGGEIMVSMMNIGHAALANWGMDFLSLPADGKVLKPGGTFLICNACADPASGEKWTKQINGMTVYTDAQLKAFLEQTGFHKIEVHKNKKGWLCITAQKR